MPNLAEAAKSYLKLEKDIFEYLFDNAKQTPLTLVVDEFQDIEKIAGKYGYVYGVHSIRSKVAKGQDDWNSQVYGIETFHCC